MKKITKGLLLLLFAFLFNSISLAQDVSFSQFNSAPLYLNPAFTGMNVCSRVTTNYRNQWPELGKTYVTYAIAGDHSIPQYHSGVGVILMTDKLGGGALSKTSGSLLYSYELFLNRKWVLRFGAKATESFMTVDYSKEITPTQLENPSSPALGNQNKKAYFDVSSGFLLYSYRYWVGFSTNHLNRPGQVAINADNNLPILLSIHGGTKIGVGNFASLKGVKMNEYLSPMFNFVKQGKYNQLDLLLTYTKSYVILGAGYNGFPIEKVYTKKGVNHDGLTILMGFKFNRLSGGYSYDYSLSKVSSAASSSHEISFSYQFCDFKKISGKKVKHFLSVGCAKF